MGKMPQWPPMPNHNAKQRRQLARDHKKFKQSQEYAAGLARMNSMPQPRCSVLPDGTRKFWIEYPNPNDPFYELDSRPTSPDWYHLTE